MATLEEDVGFFFFFAQLVAVAQPDQQGAADSTGRARGSDGVDQSWTQTAV